ncbi:hypothetical protein FWF89_02155 [Candidatus Saccharibacteria bacterium]|nr:hypothetical protein [Candidatus Saccharibacteria bacterium]
MYSVVKQISYIVRAGLAYLVINDSPIAKADMLNELIWQILPTFAILMVVSYFIAGIFYKREDDLPALGAFIYFLIYCVLLVIVWVVLKILTASGIIPF